MTHQIRRSIIVGLTALPLAGCGASTPATAAAAPFVYVANSKNDEISQYSPSSSGALTPLGPQRCPPDRSRTQSPSTRKATASTRPT